MKNVVHIDFVTDAYSDGIVVGNFLFVSGQAAVDVKTPQFIPGTIEEETARTLGNIAAIIKAEGDSMENVMKCTVHRATIDEFDRYNSVYTSYFPSIKPARTMGQSVLVEHIKIEIDCIVRLPNA